MKYPLLLLLAALAVFLPACDTPEHDHPERGGRGATTTTSTTETHTIEAPGASTSTTVRTY